jgi:hypothetical protein
MGEGAEECTDEAGGMKSAPFCVLLALAALPSVHRAEAASELPLDELLNLMDPAASVRQAESAAAAAAPPPALDELLDLMDRNAPERPAALAPTATVQEEHAEPAIIEHQRGSRRALEVPSVEAARDWLTDTGRDDLPPARIVVDGNLTDPLWEHAAASGGFWCSLERRAPSDPTEVYVARDEHYLYVGFRMHESYPDEIQATKTVRDTGLGYDDAITVQLDTFFNRRDISEFSLNALGTQSDEFAGGRSGKIEWKGDWLGAAARTAGGWTAEFAIPFSILNYNRDDTVFGVNFKRYQSRTKEHSYWSDITPKARNEEMGRLDGLSLPDSDAQKSWTFMPFVLAGKDIPDKEGEIQDTLVTGGIDIRYEPRSDLTGLISINPDFSQVEQDVTDISFSYTEKELDDNRPFFSEGSRYLANKDDENEYFYSNRAADFDYGGKSFGRFERTKFGIFGTAAPDNRHDAAGRAEFEMDDTHTASAAFTATGQSDFDSVMGVAQLDGREDCGFEYAADAAMSDTRAEDETDPVDGQGGHVKGELGWKWDYWYVKSNADHYDVSYFPALALLDEDRPGTRSGSATTGYYREKGSRYWRVVNGYTGYEYRETLGGELQSRKWFAGGSVEFENQIRTTVFVEEGPYRPADDVRGEFEDEVNNDRYFSLALDVNTRSSVFSAGGQYDWGYLGGGDYQNGSVYAWLRPIQQIYLTASYEITDYYGIYEQSIVNASWDITPENSIGVRYIYFEDDDNSTDEYFRVAFGRKARRGLDVFLVYDKDPHRAEQYSMKLVYSF